MLTGIHNFANNFCGGHARDAAFFADVGRNALERHHGAGAGLLGDFGLLDVGDVHDDAALEHFGQADFHAPQIRVILRNARNFDDFAERARFRFSGLSVRLAIIFSVASSIYLRHFILLRL